MPPKKDLQTDTSINRVSIADGSSQAYKMAVKTCREDDSGAHMCPSLKPCELKGTFFLILFQIWLLRENLIDIWEAI